MDSCLIPPHGCLWEVPGPGGPIPAQTFDLEHGEIRSVGYRLGDVAYTPDVAMVPESSFAALRNLDVWIVDALRWTAHPSHSHVERTLEWIARVRPRRAVLTNMHIDIDFNAIGAKLPPDVVAAFDGLKLQSTIL